VREDLVVSNSFLFLAEATYPDFSATLFLSQCDHGIDAGGAACGHVVRNERNTNQTRRPAIAVISACVSASVTVGFKRATTR
jgi:hypothetical protein